LSFVIQNVISSLWLSTQLPEELTERALITLKNRFIRDLRTTIIISVVFFGSRQRGEFAPDSDIDLLIIVKEKNSSVTNKIFKIADEVKRGVLSYRIPFSLHIRSVEEYKRFKKSKSPFIEEVEREGRIIYAREARD
jgi:predicted nucleotidyltransferase